MSCVYSDLNGQCTLYEPDDGLDHGDAIDENGYCTCEHDPDPSYTCEGYEDLEGEDEEEEGAHNEFPNTDPNEANWE